MKVEQVFELVKELKKADTEVQELGNDILKYIYQVIYRDYFDAELNKMSVEYNVGSISYDNAIEPIMNLKNGIGPFLDGDSSVVTYFLEMVRDNKKEFIDLFKEKIDLYFTIINNHYYDKSDFKDLAVTFNLYAMLVAYHYHKDDFDTYKTILSNVDFLINCSGFFRGYNSSYSNLEFKKRLIDKLIASNAYLECSEVRLELNKVLADITAGYRYAEKEVECLIVATSAVDKICFDGTALKEELPDCDIIALDELCTRVFANYRDDQQKDIFYHKYFLIGERLDYVNSNIKDVICVDKLVQEIVNKVYDMDFTMFNEETKVVDGKKDFQNRDFFIECMNSVLDSDTFYEVNRKLIVLKDACDYYASGSKVKALILCDKLKSGEYKTVTKGKVFEYESNTLNILEKPKTIGDRMLAIYKRLYPDIEEYISVIMRGIITKNDFISLADFNKKIDCAVENRQNEVEVEVMIQEAKRLENERQARLTIESAMDDHCKTYEAAGEQIAEEENPLLKNKPKAETVTQKRLKFFDRKRD